MDVGAEMRSPTKLFGLWILTQATNIVDAETITTEALLDLIKGKIGCSKERKGDHRDWKRMIDPLKTIEAVLHDDVWKSEISAMRCDAHSWMIEIELKISRFYQEELEI